MAILTENQIARKREKNQNVINKMRGTTGEPTISAIRYDVDLMSAINWYSANVDNKTLRKYAVAYVKQLTRDGKIKSNEAAKINATVKDASDFELRQIGIIGRLILNEQYIKEEDVAKIKTKLDELVMKHVEQEEKPEVQVKPKGPSIQDRIYDAAVGHLDEIDKHIDEFIKNKSVDFSMKTYLLQNSVSSPVAKHLGEFFKSFEKELAEAVEGKDEQLNEGYSYFTKSQLKKFHGLIKEIVDSAEQHVLNSKTTTVRRKKPVSPIKLVSRLKYMKEFPELKLKSITPTNIIGASELWVYNTKYRSLSVYKGSLSVKGSAIIGYEIAGSDDKALRNPEEFFKSTKLTKKTLNSEYKNVKTKSKTPSGRINPNCILLAAF